MTVLRDIFNGLNTTNCHLCHVFYETRVAAYTRVPTGVLGVSGLACLHPLVCPHLLMFA